MKATLVLLTVAHLASLAAALPVNAAFAHYDTLAHRHAMRSAPIVAAEPNSLLARFLSGLSKRNLAKRSAAVRVRTIGKTLTHLPRGQRVYDEARLPKRSPVERPINLKAKRQISHRGMGAPTTQSVAQLPVAQLTGLTKIAAVPTPVATAPAVEDLPDITLTLTLEPTVETVYSPASWGASLVPVATQTVYVAEQPAGTGSPSVFVAASQVKLAGPSSSAAFQEAPPRPTATNYVAPAFPDSNVLPYTPASSGY